VKLIEVPFDDLDTVDEHLGEQEREHADREHRERDLGALRDEFDPADRESEIDRESRQCAEENCLAEGHDERHNNTIVRAP
jgi:hypothetical protein